MNLSKTFDCIPHNLLIAKQHAYGFDEYVLVLIHSLFLPEKAEQSVRMNITSSSFQNYFI